ncbi:hypothetical protein LTR17_008877 [Elasticomyces elasticus]|nr:hypothetical protein LTR17_008877 [Elasticomyces elasticus]
MSASTHEAIAATIQRYTQAIDSINRQDMDSNHEDLAAIIQRYGQVAEAVNRREMARFTEEVRQMWASNPPEEEDWDPWGEGYTDEGAFTLCVYKLAFLGSPERHGQLCEAEEKDQVLLHLPVDALGEKIRAPLRSPAPQGELEEKLCSLRTQLQDQLDQSVASNTKSIQLPGDFKDLMLITNGIRGAGVPAETAYTVLVYPVKEHYAGPKSLRYILRRAESEGFTPLAGWEIGSCQQHRHIYYVFCHKKGDTTPDNAFWRIFDKVDVDCDEYENLADFIQHETVYVEDNPGGAQQEGNVVQLCYPF